MTPVLSIALLGPIAKELGVKEETLKAWKEANGFPAFRVGRSWFVDLPALDEWAKVMRGVGSQKETVVGPGSGKPWPEWAQDVLLKNQPGGCGPEGEGVRSGEQSDAAQNEAVISFLSGRERF